MSFIHKYTYDEKAKIFLEYQAGVHGFRELCRIYGIAQQSLKAWIRLYETFGIEGLRTGASATNYTRETKQAAVKDYLAHKLPVKEILKKYQIRSETQLRKWIKKYNGHEDLKASRTGGTAIMTKGRKTTFNERVEIVRYCIEHGHNYAGTAIKYGISYQQARSYTVKYETGGVNALQDRRGRKKPVEEMTELEKLRAENKLLRAEKEHAEMEVSFLKKTRRDREEVGLSLVRNEQIYQAIKEEHEEHGYPIRSLCELGNVSRAAYYKWLRRDVPYYETENLRIAAEIEKMHAESPDMGYRRIRDDLERYHDVKASDKRVLRICRKKKIKSTIKYSNNGCTIQAANPQFIAENILNRDFTAEAPNQKWLTDVTEFKYYSGTKKHKVYLSAILDLYDRRIVSYVIGNSNNNALVFDTFDKAVAENPEAGPLLHSDRGFQYTNRAFHARLEAAGMTQSMSRVGKCIDNGPMEGFWGILKRERYYGRRFTDRESLVKMIGDYITYYNTRRLQRNLGVLTPMEKHEQYLKAA